MGSGFICFSRTDRCASDCPNVVDAGGSEARRGRVCRVWAAIHGVEGSGVVGSVEELAATAGEKTTTERFELSLPRELD